MTTATLSNRGQVTIPKQFRTQLGLQPGTVFTFKVEGKSLIMTVRNPFEAAHGILKGAFDGLSVDEIVREMRGC